MALVAQHTFDVLGGVLYIVCLLLETGIFLSHGLWLWRTRKARREAKLAGKDFDELIDDPAGPRRNPSAAHLPMKRAADVEMVPASDLLQRPCGTPK
ncbi:MAG: hypothetical protein M1817_000844 [Caeruleum heppii]|nr:MAG: hypothetical protein M1817_000844 [Caeruleum heppii]